MNEAVRVSSFMEEAEVGRWRIRHFTITERRYTVELLAAQMEGNEQGDMRAERTIPPGDYVCLTRKATPMELDDIKEERVVDSFAPDADHVPIMSDTPAEVNEHIDAFRDAHGKVVITGLGLGVIVSGLLAHPDVDTITVVEIDKDVIALTGPYYEDEPRVTIVNDDAIHFAETYDGPGFDYAWHDIWSHIADRNLDRDDLAEHGISYERMFQAYSGIADDQGAWAYEHALAMLDAKQVMKERMDKWAERFIEAGDEERLDMLEEFHMRRMLPQLDRDEPIPDHIRDWMNDQMSVRDNCYVQLRARGGEQMAADFRDILNKAESPDDPLDRPNEVPEANIAR